MHYMASLSLASNEWKWIWVRQKDENIPRKVFGRFFLHSFGFFFVCGVFFRLFFSHMHVRPQQYVDLLNKHITRVRHVSLWIPNVCYISQSRQIRMPFLLLIGIHKQLTRQIIPAVCRSKWFSFSFFIWQMCVCTVESLTIAPISLKCTESERGWQR